MRPVLFELGPLTVNSYGVFVALAFGAAWLVLRHELERRAKRGDAAGPLVIAAALGGLVGARVYWYGEHAGDATLGDFLSASGFTWYGGVLGASSRSSWSRVVCESACRTSSPPVRRRSRSVVR